MDTIDTKIESEELTAALRAISESFKSDKGVKTRDLSRQLKVVEINGVFYII